MKNDFVSMEKQFNFASRHATECGDDPVFDELYDYAGKLRYQLKSVKKKLKHQKEKDKIIQWAINLTDSIIAGDYKLPPEMCYSLNMLQDSVYEYSRKAKLNIQDQISRDYKVMRNSCRSERWKRISQFMER